MKTIVNKILFLSILFCTLLPIGQLEAHAPDQSYIYLRIYKDAMGGRFELTAKDLNQALGLNLDDKLSMEALSPHIPNIHAYLKTRSGFKSVNGVYPIRFTETTVLNLDEMNDFAKFAFEMQDVTAVPDELDVYYNVLFEKNPIHKGILIIEYNWKAGIVDNEALLSLVFDGNNAQQELSLKDASIWKGFVALVKLGIWHIWIGLDHILFIFALILPAVVRRRKPNEIVVGLNLNTWIPVEQFKPAFIYIIKIITFFTIAHSITLGLAAMEVVSLPSRIVETIIAVSIALAAYHNINPIFHGKEWMIAFGFGLFHGFGFASVLGEKGLSGDFMILSLLGFNVGVEIGQLLIICAIFPILYLIRKKKIYSNLISYGSVVLILIAFYWAIERGFEVDLPLGAYFWKAYHAILG